MNKLDEEQDIVDRLKAVAVWDLLPYSVRETARDAITHIKHLEINEYKTWYETHQRYLDRIRALRLQLIRELPPSRQAIAWTQSHTQEPHEMLQFNDLDLAQILYLYDYYRLHSGNLEVPRL